MINARNKRASCKRRTAVISAEPCSLQRERIQIWYDRSAQIAKAISVTSKVSIVGASQSGDFREAILACVVFQDDVVGSSK